MISPIARRRGGAERPAAVDGTLPPAQVEKLRRRRRHPRPTQSDYLHLRYLVRGLAGAFASAAPPVRTALDVGCGSRPYEDLLPRGAVCTGLDVTDHYGVADVVTDEFLPFDDAQFDLVFSTEAFYYLRDAESAVAEIRRVLRPAGTLVVTVPLVWEYSRTTFEHRYTEHELRALFAGWDDVEVVENGGRAVSWATLTGRLIRLAHDRVPRGRRALLEPPFGAAYLAVNAIGAALDAAERRFGHGDYTLPTNLMLTARRPLE